METARGGQLPAQLEAEIRKIYQRSPLYPLRFPTRRHPV